MKKQGLYIGLMSGTSIDAIDACLVEIDAKNVHLRHQHSHPIPQKIKTEILNLALPSNNELHRVQTLDRELGLLFSKAVTSLLSKHKLTPDQIIAIGSHGQTIRHCPDSSPPYTLQIADPSTIAEETKITTVANFRQRDIAAGGQGAPLLPSFHLEHLIESPSDLVLNIGGIANISYLQDKDGQATGFDTGPGNMLMDYWVNKHTGTDFDRDGTWAASGRENQRLLTHLKNEPYLSKKPPKSTGRELFNHIWLEQKLATFGEEVTPEDIQRTLMSYTTETISDSINRLPEIKRVIVCGGGARNLLLIKSIEQQLPERKIITSDQLGIAAEWVEATAFAWYAHNTINGQTTNVASCTGALGNRILGGIFQA